MTCSWRLSCSHDFVPPTKLFPLCLADPKILFHSSCDLFRRLNLCFPCSHAFFANSMSPYNFNFFIRFALSVLNMCLRPVTIKRFFLYFLLVFFV
jgi:hypothetical protein